jgi:hypothetical protein
MYFYDLFEYDPNRLCTLVLALRVSHNLNFAGYIPVCYLTQSSMPYISSKLEAKSDPGLIYFGKHFFHR